MEKYLERLLLEILKQIDVEKMIKELLDSVKGQLVCYLVAAAAKSGNPIDDALVRFLAGALGVDPDKCKLQMPA